LQVRQLQMQQRGASVPMPEGDPLDPEYQKKMYEAIQQQNILENFNHAMEHSPEVFGQVDMLYVDMSVNGEPVKAFIDSGAQMTIMTQSCAEKCHIMRLVDKRFQGVAMGVGQSKIIGRIHTCALRVGAQFISTSVTVLEQKSGPQFIFGLDNLKRHQCCINLKAGELQIGSCDVALPFLPSHEVPEDFNERRVQPEDMV
jgi:DNA damage-inducible protein 1